MDNLIGYIIGIPILLFAAYLILAIPYSTVVKPLYLKTKKYKSNKSDSQFIKENFDDLIHYWAGVFEGTIKLEDGSKFNDNTIYNPKYLKYSKKYLEIASISAAKNAKIKKFIMHLEQDICGLLILMKTLKIKSLIQLKMFKRLWISIIMGQTQNAK